MRVLVLGPAFRDPDARDRLRALAGLGPEVIVALPNGEAATDGPLRLVPVPVKGRDDDPGLRWHRATLRRLLADHRPDLIHLECPPEAPLASDMADLAGRLAIPFVLASWTGPDPEAGLLERRRARRVLERAAGVIGGSNAARADLAAAAPAAIEAMVPLTGLALPPPVERPVPGELRIGFVGRLVPERGLDQLILALTQTYGRWRLDILGSGPDQESLERLVERHGLASRVRWLGGLRRDALDGFWAAIDCLVVPWRSAPTGEDGHPELLLDAMGRGVAPVVTGVGALPDVVGDVGPVVATPGELTQVLQRWVAEPARTRPIGAAARRRVLENFVTAAVATRTHAVWTRVLAERRVTAA